LKLDLSNFFGGSKENLVEGIDNVNERVNELDEKLKNQNKNSWILTKSLNKKIESLENLNE